MDIFDMQGRYVETLVEKNIHVGYHAYEWNAEDQASGLYFIKLQTGIDTQVQKVLLMK